MSKDVERLTAIILLVKFRMLLAVSRDVEKTSVECGFYRKSWEFGY